MIVINPFLFQSSGGQTTSIFEHVLKSVGLLQ